MAACSGGGKKAEADSADASRLSSISAYVSDIDEKPLPIR